MDCNDIFKLQLITLFDSLSFGLIYAFLSPYMLILGGDNLTVGILAVSTLTAQLLSSDIVRDLINYQGKRAALYTIFNVSAVCHALLFLTNSCWVTIAARVLFASINQSSIIIKNILLKKVPPEEKQSQLVTFNLLSSSGYLIGPIIAGCLFDVSFAICCFLASLLTMVNIGLLLLISDDADDVPFEDSGVSVFQRTVYSIKDSILLFQGSNYKHNWDLIIVKYLFTASTTVFFSKFTQILKHNFQSDEITIGYTTSYMNALMFIGIYFSVKMRNTISNISSMLIINVAFVLLSICTFVACYSPEYAWYFLICIPIVLLRTLLLDIWDDFVSERENDNLRKLSSSISISAGMTIPILFGVLCNHIGHHAVIIFSVLPLIACCLIMNRYTFQKHYKNE